MISNKFLTLIYAHASKLYPEECCGLISSSGVRPCQNIAQSLHLRNPQQYPRTPNGSYVLSAPDVMFLIRSLKTSSPVTIIYHSHPDVGAYFSDEDKAFAVYEGIQAYPVSYLVVDVRQDGVKGANLYSYTGNCYQITQEYSADLGI